MLYDTHAHLDFSDFAGDLDGIVARAADAGVTRIIAIATDLDSSGKAIALAERFPGVYAAVGVHPCYVEEAPDDIREPLARLAGHGKVVAIGRQVSITITGPRTIPRESPLSRRNSGACLSSSSRWRPGRG